MSTGQVVDNSGPHTVSPAHPRASRAAENDWTDPRPAQTSTLVVAATPDEIANLPREQRGELITHALIESKSWLAVATKGTDPTPIAEFRAWAATVAEMTRQKGLAEEIQNDALEMVRRAERGIGLVVRNGQEAGTVARRGDIGGSAGLKNNPGPRSTESVDLVKPSELFASGTDWTQTYQVTDNVTDAEFDAAIEDARTEGNLSRANVIRKVQGVKNVGLTPAEKLTRIRVMSTTGASSHQIARDIGVTPEYVRDRARHHGIEIVADKVVGRVKRIDSNRIVQETAMTLEGLVSGIKLVVFDDLDPDQIENWATSLTDSLRALNRLAKQIKEMTQ